ncbi:lytic transglycosylase domain-containing protein [Novosphingobium mathurense]|nr:lytic transglycosylase domain-containing protein [Novosphingobium mathurense]
MTQVACEFGIPVDLMDAVVAHESGYNPNVISRAGAMGMMQIMPETARSLGLAFPWDPVANMRAGARYLRNQIYRFGRMDLALAAYNAGPERKSLNAGYIPAIPETLGYVRTITTNWTRLAAYTPDLTAAAARASAATVAVRTAGYREVDLLIYYGINAANPI